MFSREKKKCHYRPVAFHIGIKIHASFPKKRCLHGLTILDICIQRKLHRTAKC